MNTWVPQYPDRPFAPRGWYFDQTVTDAASAKRVAEELAAEHPYPAAAFEATLLARLDSVYVGPCPVGALQDVEADASATSPRGAPSPDNEECSSTTIRRGATIDTDERLADIRARELFFLTAILPRKAGCRDNQRGSRS